MEKLCLYHLKYSRRNIFHGIFIGMQKRVNLEGVLFKKTLGVFGCQKKVFKERKM